MGYPRSIIEFPYSRDDESENTGDLSSFRRRIYRGPPALGCKITRFWSDCVVCQVGGSVAHRVHRLWD